MWFLPNTDIEDRLIMQAHLFDSDVRDSIRAFKVHRFPDCAAVRSDNHLEVILPIIRHKVAASPQWNRYDTFASRTSKRIVNLDPSRFFAIRIARKTVSL